MFFNKRIYLPFPETSPCQPTGLVGLFTTRVLFCVDAGKGEPWPPTELNERKKAKKISNNSLSLSLSHLNPSRSSFRVAMAFSSSWPNPRILAALILFLLVGLSFVGAGDVKQDDDDGPQPPSCDNPFELVILSNSPLLPLPHFLVLIKRLWFLFGFVCALFCNYM